MFISRRHCAMVFAPVEMTRLCGAHHTAPPPEQTSAATLKADRATGKRKTVLRQLQCNSSSLFSVSKTKVLFHFADVIQFDAPFYGVTTESQSNRKWPEQDS